MTTVLVTGANSDIGTATVRRLGGPDVSVIATVRSDGSERSLREAFDDRLPDWLSIERLDVSDLEAGEEAMHRLRPDVLVNNAGSTLLGPVAEVDVSAAEEQFRASVLGPIFLARHAVAAGRCRRIINVGSVVSEGVIPFTGWYGASKAAFEVLSDVWRIEATSSGLAIVTVECGAIGTDVWKRAGDELSEGGDPATATARHRWAELTSLASDSFADPDDVAKAIARAALDPNPPSVLRVGFGARWVPLIQRLPRRFREPLTRALFGLRR